MKTSIFAFVCRVICAALLVLFSMPFVTAQPSNLTIDYNTTLTGDYSNTNVSIIDGLNPPTTVTATGTFLSLSVTDTGILNLSDCTTGGITAGGNSTVNLLGTLQFNYGGLALYKNATLNLNAPMMHYNYGSIMGYDNSTINVLSGYADYIPCVNINIFDGAAQYVSFSGTANIYGGRLDTFGFGRTTNIYGGSVSCIGTSTTNSNINIYGGSFHSNGGLLQSTVNVHGGNNFINLNNGSTGNVYGGNTVGTAGAGSITNIYSGEWYGFAYDGTINIYGGTVDTIIVTGSDSILNFYGRNLIYDTVNQIVTGTLRDGTSAACQIEFYNFNTVTVNLINDPPASVSGSLLFEGLVVHAVPQNVAFTFRPSNGGTPMVQSFSIAATGEFTVPTLPRTAGVLHIKGDKYLAVNVPLDLSAGNVTGLATDLTSGDASNDNQIDIGDFGALIAAYGDTYNVNSPNAPASDVAADFNGDGRIDIVDFSILVSNYGFVGDL